VEISEIVTLIEQKITPVSVAVDGADCSFKVRVISAEFAQMRPVQRQQKVLGCFSEFLADGRLHALTVEAFTPEEWAAHTEATLTQLTI
jgi:acid stress-induced BolA-like protein IbaG/YrbA|tara:strand:- start:15964 stop:16230 length:267 start_codon:yes stop_codon:yes gene_type:complete